jgi:hypothetical protein
VCRRVAILDAAIVPAAEKVPKRIKKRRANGNASFAETFPGFVNRDAKEGVMVDWQQ